HNAWRRVTELSIMLLPLSFATPYDVKVIPLLSLVFYGIYLIVSSKKTRSDLSHFSFIVYSTLLVTLYSALNIIYHNIGWDPISYPAQNILFVCIAAAMTRPFEAKFLYVGFTAAAI